ncbi:chitin-binding protein [Streptomyces sp. 150FB]|uniref:lytic polysaccharide monooxygenase auxiliary activity family 9 protein n=1 Tax=Streptomyces sp. 150FB TaxID=1576605 RepID=UPI00058927CF|nr:lytic polysaccharide monooxygenase [Streptomyces sp. 150FB]KIF75894.1 chitin-binding protein [Streptomyces sp. 150FB]
MVISSVRVRRMLALAGAAGVAAAVLSVPTPASAHGVSIMPGSRTYLCYKDLLEHSSTQMPSNPACAQAVQQTGTTPLYNWFAVLDSNAGGRGAGYVPDGTLCSAGDRSPFNFSAYNAARADWPTTHLTSGANIEVKYSNWAAHPGRFEVYLTKSGWSPSTALAWGDLEHLQTVANPPQSGGVGTDGGHYYWNLQLPQRSGQHMLFIQWIRSDSQENFFSCADVVFDGGTGQVTGLAGGEQSAAEVEALGAGFKNTKADPIHAAGHDGHAAAGAELAASTDAPEVAAPAAVAGLGALVFAGSAMVFNRRRRAKQHG